VEEALLAMEGSLVEVEEALPAIEGSSARHAEGLLMFPHRAGSDSELRPPLFDTPDLPQLARLKWVVPSRVRDAGSDRDLISKGWRST
jgi:hypothetical protein